MGANLGLIQLNYYSFNLKSLIVANKSITNQIARANKSLEILEKSKANK